MPKFNGIYGTCTVRLCISEYSLYCSRQVVYPFEEKAKVLALLRKHIFQNIVKVKIRVVEMVRVLE